MTVTLSQRDIDGMDRHVAYGVWALQPPYTCLINVKRNYTNSAIMQAWGTRMRIKDSALNRAPLYYHTSDTEQGLGHKPSKTYLLSQWTKKK